MKERISEVLERHINCMKELQKNNYVETMEMITKIELESIQQGNKIMIAGNGGSAADAQHFAAELVGRFLLERKGIPAIALTTDSSILTCLGNDYGYDYIFARQIEALGESGDVFVGISTSGNSKNIMDAVIKAKEKGIITIGLLGRDGGILKEMCDYSLIIPFKETSHIQEAHITSIHMMCEIIEKEIANK